MFLSLLCLWNEKLGLGDFVICQSRSLSDLGRDISTLVSPNHWIGIKCVSNALMDLTKRPYISFSFESYGGHTEPNDCKGLEIGLM